MRSWVKIIPPSKGAKLARPSWTFSKDPFPTHEPANKSGVEDLGVFLFDFFHPIALHFPAVSPA